MQNLRMIQQSKYRNLYGDGCAGEDFVVKLGMCTFSLFHSLSENNVDFSCLHRTSFDDTFSDSTKVTSIEAYKIAKRLIQAYDPPKDKERLETYCR